MKKNLHPAYQDILFVDTATGKRFVCGSTLQPKDTETFEGKEYPVYKVPVSSDSHPFFTGSDKLVDAEGRVDRFNKRYVTKQRPANETAPELKPVAEKKVAAKKTAVKKAVKKVVKKAAVKKTEDKEKS
ncbi:50S ribosomal protein L31 type B [Candidatus Aerophobetes bacterium]|uniref:Large ribosomal subunit protein bL31B n=1 Tax=Aerophobetes bacterium TaxID=2030807 RepID=A0A2A4WZX4_UNCAE|nr:MAG: 50S ribosomal protein L31 type B [Candidatus Aerophobetes bacterium]